MPRRNNHKIWGILSRPPVRSGTKSFRSGIRVTKDRTFILTSRQKGVFIRSCVQTKEGRGKKRGRE